MQFVQRIVGLAEGDAMNLLVELDLSFTQARMVFMLAHAGEMPITDIASGMGLSAASAGRNVDQLVKLGIVERKENPVDRRVKLVSLSPQGMAVAGEQFEEKRRALRTFVERLPEEETDRLLGAIEPILEADYLRPAKKDSSCQM